MKKLLTTVTMFSLLSLSSSLWAQEISVKVSGMVCSMCAQGIEKKFSKLKEVETIKVNLDEKLVSIKTKENLDVSNEKIKELITEAGYNVANIERKK